MVKITCKQCGLESPYYHINTSATLVLGETPNVVLLTTMITCPACAWYEIVEKEIENFTWKKD